MKVSPACPSPAASMSSCFPAPSPVISMGPCSAPTGRWTSAPGVSKASALADLCAERGIHRADVIAFGDMPNDLPMLSWAGHGVAVANAHPDVLTVADEVTAGNDDGGVARVLERLVQSLTGRE